MTAFGYDWLRLAFTKIGIVINNTVKKWQTLKGRDVMLYPDLGAYEKWNIKASEIRKHINSKIILSTLLEDEATDLNRENGLDIADFIITELKSNKATPKIQSHFSPALQLMIDKNKALLILINRLELEEL